MLICKDGVKRHIVCQNCKLIVFFKVSRTEERHFELEIPVQWKFNLEQFRTSNNNLRIETGRHSNTPRGGDRLCKWCGENKNISVVEDEYHVLF